MISKKCFRLTMSFQHIQLKKLRMGRSRPLVAFTNNRVSVIWIVASMEMTYLKIPMNYSVLMAVVDALQYLLYTV